MDKISDKALSEMTGQNKFILLGQLTAAFNKNPKTIERWIHKKDMKLTTPTAVAIIKRVTGLHEREILEKAS